MAQAMLTTVSQVRTVVASDLDAICAILNREIAEGWAHFGRREVTADEALAELSRSRDTYPWLVAETDGELIGYAKASAWNTRGAYEWTAEVGVYIDADHQGQGVGKMLYSALLDELRSRGFRCVLAGVALPNDASVRLLEGFGMEFVGTLPRVGFKHGKWIDVGYWALNFGGDDPPAPIEGWSGI